MLDYDLILRSIKIRILKRRRDSLSMIKEIESEIPPDEAKLRKFIISEKGRYVYLDEKIYDYLKYLTNLYLRKIDMKPIFELISIIKSIGPLYIHIGGAGDALLLLTTFYDDAPEQVVLSITGSIKSMESFFDVFPCLKKIYFIKYTDHITNIFLRKILSNIKSTVLGMGVTPEDNYRTEWSENLDIFEKYKIKKRPNWARSFIKDKIVDPQVTILPSGNISSIKSQRRNMIEPKIWENLINFITEFGIKPIILGIPDEGKLYPVDSRCINKRSYFYKEQMEIIASSDLVISADTWGKTLSALVGIPTIVFDLRYGFTYKLFKVLGWRDPSHYVFIKPWDEIKLVKTFNEFKNVFKNIINLITSKTN